VNARAWAVFAAVSTLWGMPDLPIKVTVDDGVSPVFVTWARVVLGATVLVGLAWRTGVFGSLRGRARWLSTLALTEIAAPFTPIALGEQRVSSSLAAILIAAAPLFVVVLALRFDKAERVGGPRLAALAIGLIGVIAFVGIEMIAKLDEFLGAAAILGAACCYAVGPVVFKRHLADSIHAPRWARASRSRPPADPGGGARPARVGALGSRSRSSTRHSALKTAATPGASRSMTRPAPPPGSSTCCPTPPSTPPPPHAIPNTHGLAAHRSYRATPGTTRAHQPAVLPSPQSLSSLELPMKIPARKLATGDVVRLNDWQLHVTAVKRDVGTAVLTAEFGFLFHFTRDEVVDVIEGVHTPPAAA
jgi:hypothetical protein